MGRPFRVEENIWASSMHHLGRHFERAVQRRSNGSMQEPVISSEPANGDLVYNPRRLDTHGRSCWGCCGGDFVLGRRFHRIRFPALKFKPEALPAFFFPYEICVLSLKK